MASDTGAGRQVHRFLLLQWRLLKSANYRPISELKKNQESLKGMESQRLRTFCSSEMMVPGRDLDAYGKLLWTADLSKIKADFDTAARIRAEKAHCSEEEGRTAYAQEIYKMRWGPTQVPVYNLLGLFTLLNPFERTEYLAVARYLIDSAKVPVDAPDLSGTRALSHCFSTKPAFDLEYAQMLYDAGGDVNTRNRYGNTVASEIVQIYTPSDPVVIQQGKAGLTWFMTHGGNVDMADGDGMSVRDSLISMTQKGWLSREFLEIVEAEESRRKLLGPAICALCGRVDPKLLSCKRCRSVRYCSPSLRSCQVLDWPRHKKSCKTSK